MQELLLQIDLDITQYKLGILAFVTAFIVAMIMMPPLIKLIKHFHLFDVPDKRKEHSTPDTYHGWHCFGNRYGSCLPALG
jgi:UDP-GlcNAc:undecaprenyl-phosphate GlcNAc-1-phosphate transferase